jgi:hypothetical protein
MNVSKENQEIKKLLKELKNNHGAVGLKLSSEESGHSLDFIDFTNNRLANDILPLNMKIGGPNARTDIINGLKIGVSGFTGPMIESPFGVKQYVIALRDFAGLDALNELLISINLESVTAYEKIDEILNTPEVVDVDQIVIGSSDLAFSVEKQKTDPYLLKMVTEMAQKGKKMKKSVRIGGMIGLSNTSPDALERLLRETDADRINTGNVCFDIKTMGDIREAYVKALNFEYKLNAFWYQREKEELLILEKRFTSANEKLSRL